MTVHRIHTNTHMEYIHRTSNACMEYIHRIHTLNAVIEYMHAAHTDKMRTCQLIEKTKKEICYTSHKTIHTSSDHTRMHPFCVCVGLIDVINLVGYSHFPIRLAAAFLW